MAKSSRSSTKKNNNQRKAASIFAPAENARAERLSAKLLELAKSAKPESSDVKMNVEEDEGNEAGNAKGEANDTAMDVDSSSRSLRPRIGKKRIEKKKQRKSKVVFPKYSDRMGQKKKAVK